MTAEDLAALHARCFCVPRPWTVAEFRAFLSDHLCHLDTLENGFVLGRTIAGEAELLTIAVDPESRGKGQGRTLLALFEASARARGATDAFLEVSATNAPAIGLYRNAGYHQVGKRPAYCAGTDALILRKTLSPSAA